MLDEDRRAVVGACLQAAVFVTLVSSELFSRPIIPTQTSSCSELYISAVREVRFPEVSNDILK